MFRRLIKASAIVIGVGLVAGCAVTPVKLGSAAIVGDQRISIATLGTEAANLSQAAKQYPSVVNLTPVQETQATLTWLIRYQVNEEVASQAGITVSAAQAEAALAAAYAAAVTSAEQQGLTNVTLLGRSGCLSNPRCCCMSCCTVGGFRRRCWPPAERTLWILSNHRRRNRLRRPTPTCRADNCNPPRRRRGCRADRESPSRGRTLRC